MNTTLNTTTPLVDICAGQFCPLCGRDGTRIDGYNPHNIRECCGMSLSWQWETEEQYHALYTYNNDYHLCQQKAEGQRGFWDRDTEALTAAHARLQTLQALFDLNWCETTVVDVGAGTGAFATVCQMHGITTVAYEPNQVMVVKARSLGRDFVKLGTWYNVASSDHCLTMIVTMFDVFEHLTRPAQCLAHLQTHMTLSDVLVIEMPELYCPDSLRDGMAWKHLRPMQHVCLYSEPAARDMFTRAGFRIVATVRPLQGRLGKIAYYLMKDA